MGVLNINVGGTDLDNGTWRRIFGQPVNVRNTTGNHTIRTVFHIEADDTPTLQARWATTKTEFNLKDSRVILNYDDAAGTPLEDLEQGLNGITNIITSVNQTEGSSSTAFSIEAILDVVAVFEEQDGIAGQVGEISVTRFFTAGKVEGRTVTAAFGASDDGVTSGSANYAAARSTLLTAFLEVDGDGGRDATTGLALTNESVQSTDEDDNLVVITLAAEEVVVDFSSEPALRSSDLTINTSQPDAWSDDSAAGQVPTLVTVTGQCNVDKDALSGNLHDVWLKIRANVEAEVKSQTGKTDIELMSFSLVSDRKASMIAFNAMYRSDNTVVFSYRRVDQETETPLFQIYIDADGCEIIQKRPGDNPVLRTITINRTGVGFINLDPQFDGIQFGLVIFDPGFYILANRVDASEGPIIMQETNNVFIQQSSFAYRRVNGTGVDIVQVGI